MSANPTELRLMTLFDQCARLVSWLADACEAVAGSGPLNAERVAAPAAAHRYASDKLGLALPAPEDRA